MPWMTAAAIAASTLIGAYSSQQAGKAASSADTAAANLQNQQYQQTRQDFAPWRSSGVGALGQINALMGLGGSTPTNSFAVAPQSAPSGNAEGLTPGMLAAQQANGTRGGAGRSITGMALGGILGAKKNNSPIQDISQAIALGRPITDAQWAQAGFGPGGADRNGNVNALAPSPSLAQANPTIAPPGSGAPVDAQTAQQNAFANFHTDPGYQFAVDQGTKALTNSAAARGVLNSGNTAIALQNYGQGMAEQQYGNYFARLQSLAGLGQSATGSTASAGAQAAGNAGNALMAGGAARASAYGGVAQAGNQGIQNYLMSQYLPGMNGGGTPNYNASTPSWFGG